MIVVRVELWAKGIRDHPRSRELARMHICNVGGDGDRGDYECSTLRGRSDASLARGIVQRRGRVLGHARQRLHVWHLVAKALAGMGYGGAQAPVRVDDAEPSLFADVGDERAAP